MLLGLANDCSQDAAELIRFLLQFPVKFKAYQPGSQRELKPVSRLARLLARNADLVSEV